MPRVDPKVPAALAIGSGVIALLGVYATWLTVTIGGFSGPGGTQSGWDGRDGWTVAGTAAVATVAGFALLIGRRDAWVANLLILAGSTTIVIAIVNLASASAKADDIHLRYAIPATNVSAQAGPGLWLVALAGLGILAGALLAHVVRR